MRNYLRTRLLVTASLLLLALGVLSLSGCSGRKSSLLLGRFARGTLTDARSVAQPLAMRLMPGSRTIVQNGVVVIVTHAPREYQDDLFRNEAIFGKFAGKNPYYPQQLVFYVRITNQSSSELFVDITQFKLIDNRGNQLETIGHDYIEAFTKHKTPISSTTRGIVEGASPGYFGFSLPVGKMFSKSQWRYALLKQSALQQGFLYPNVVHDGLIAFWTPSNLATELTLRMSNIRTDFDSKGEPATALDFVFEFDLE